MASLKKNISFTGISQFLYAILAFLLIPFVARYLGPEGLGLYSLAATIGFFVSLATDWGLSTLLTREVAQYKSLAARFFSYCTSIKFVLSLLSFLILLIYLYLGDFGDVAIQTILIFTLASIISSFSQLVFSVFRAFEKMHYEALAVFIDKFLSVLLGITFLVLGFGIRVFITSFVIAAIIKFLYAVYILSKNFFLIKVRFNRKKSVVLLSVSITFGLSTFLAFCYNYIDILMLTEMTSMEAVGLYSGSYKFLNLTSMIPAVLATAFLPQLSRFAQNRQLLMQTFFKGCRYLCYIVLPLVPATFLLAGTIVFLVLGPEYEGSVGSLKILVVASMGQMFNTFFVPLYAAVNMQKKIVYFQIVGLCFNVLLNIILIPKFSFYGAAIATVLTEWCIFIFILTQAKKKIFTPSPAVKEFWTFFYRILIASIVMSIGILVTQSLNFESKYVICIAFVLYAAILQLSGGLNFFQLYAQLVDFLKSREHIDKQN